jgi:hypothetical protein
LVIDRINISDNGNLNRSWDPLQDTTGSPVFATATSILTADSLAIVPMQPLVMHVILLRIWAHFKQLDAQDDQISPAPSSAAETTYMVVNDPLEVTAKRCLELMSDAVSSDSALLSQSSERSVVSLPMTTSRIRPDRPLIASTVRRSPRLHNPQGFKHVQLDGIPKKRKRTNLLGVQVDYNVVHLRTSLVQLFVLLLQNFEKVVQKIELKRFGGAPNGYPFAPLQFIGYSSATKSGQSSTAFRYCTYSCPCADSSRLAIQCSVPPSEVTLDALLANKRNDKAPCCPVL